MKQIFLYLGGIQVKKWFRSPNMKPENKHAFETPEQRVKRQGLGCVLIFFAIGIPVMVIYYVFNVLSTDPAEYGRNNSMPAALYDPIMINDVSVVISSYSITNMLDNGQEYVVGANKQIIRIRITCELPQNETCDINRARLKASTNGDTLREINNLELSGGEYKEYEIETGYGSKMKRLCFSIKSNLLSLLQNVYLSLD
jgi:hypothetical protein